MTAVADYQYDMYLLSLTALKPIRLSEGTLIASFYDPQFNGTGAMVPDLANWFQLARFGMELTFPEFEVELQPKTSGNDDQQEELREMVYDLIGPLHVEMSEHMQFAYEKTVELKL